MWQYKQQVIESVEDVPKDVFGFIYRVVHEPTGQIYIGKKVLYFNLKRKLTKKDLEIYEGVQGRKPKFKVIQKESDWKTYYGSNKHLKESIEKYGKEEFERYIIKLAPSKKLLTYYETQYQFVHQVLEKPEEFYNDNILGKFFTKDFE